MSILRGTIQCNGVGTVLVRSGYCDKSMRKPSAEAQDKMYGPSIKQSAVQPKTTRTDDAKDLDDPSGV